MCFKQHRTLFADFLDCLFIQTLQLIYRRHTRALKANNLRPGIFYLGADDLTAAALVKAKFTNCNALGCTLAL